MWNSYRARTASLFVLCMCVLVTYGIFAEADTNAKVYPAERRSFCERARAAVAAAPFELLVNDPSWMGESDQAGAEYGICAAGAGDVNGDGYSDVIVGAYLFDNGQTNEGRAFVYHGDAGGLSDTPAWVTESDQTSANYGWFVAGAGDVNGDGYSDVIVGAYLYDNGETDEGRAYVYHGGPTGLSSTPDWTAEGDQVEGHFGWCVAGAGDVNGDGYSDVIVGAILYDGGQTDEGRAFLYHGSPSGLSVTPDWIGECDQDSARTGVSVASAGDVNGDGFSDVIVGADYYENGETFEGRADVYYGGPSGLSGTPAWTAESDWSNAQFGYSVASAGDVNGDGYSDILVGAPKYANPLDQEGAAYVYYGGASGLSAIPDWKIEGEQWRARLGFCVAGAGDVNLDTYSDVIVGAHKYSDRYTDEGRAYVYHGGGAGLSTSPAWLDQGEQNHAYLGISVACAGDVNADDCADIVVGAFRYDNGETDEGIACVYHGVPNPVPVELDGFEAVGTREGILLRWSATGSSPSRSFVVRRATADPDGEYLTLDGDPTECRGAGATSYSYLDVEVISGTTYYYKLEFTDVSGGTAIFGPFPVMVSGYTERPWLGQNSPNPFRGTAGTRIDYSISRPGRVEIRILDASGRLIKVTSADGKAGENRFIWDGADDRGRQVEAGVYLYQIRSDGFIAQRRMILLD